MAAMKPSTWSRLTWGMQTTRRWPRRVRETCHPGGTSRILTVAQLEYQRDVALPMRLFRTAELRGWLSEFARRGPEQKRISNAARPAPLRSTRTVGLRPVKRTAPSHAPTWKVSGRTNTGSRSTTASPASSR